MKSYTSAEARMLIAAQYRFGEIPCDHPDPENIPFFEMMFEMEPMERIEAYMGMTPALREQYWSHWCDVIKTRRL